MTFFESNEAIKRAIQENGKDITFCGIKYIGKFRTRTRISLIKSEPRFKMDKMLF